MSARSGNRRRISAPAPAAGRHVPLRIHRAGELGAEGLPGVVEIAHATERPSGAGETALRRLDHREVQVWRKSLRLQCGGVAGIADAADLLAGRDRIALLYRAIAQVRIDGVGAVAVVEDHRRAERAPAVG